MEKVSEKIKAGRAAKGVTIEELSQATLISVAIIKDIENGAFDKYKGDEQYVKMYLKKIARYLDLNDDIAAEYIALTQEIKLADLQKEEEKQKEMDKKGSTTFVDKMSDTFKNIQVAKPQPVSRKGVYEDHYILRIVKYAIIVLLLIAIVFVIWYSVISTRQDDTSSFDRNDNTTLEGDVAKEEESDTDTDTEPEEPVEPESTVTFTKNADLDYSFALAEGNETFKLKIEFVGRSWASMQVNGSDYSAFESRIYNNTNISNDLAAEPEVVELDFTVAEFENLSLRVGYNEGHRFYINDQLVPLEDSDFNNGQATLNLALVK